MTYEEHQKYGVEKLEQFGFCEEARAITFAYDKQKKKIKQLGTERNRLREYYKAHGDIGRAGSNQKQLNAAVKRFKTADAALSEQETTE